MARKKSNKNVKTIKNELKVEATDIKTESSGDVEVKTEAPVKGKVKSEISTAAKKDWRYFSSKKGVNKEEPARGVVYVGSLPHGFFEQQLESYFGQFGKVTGVYVPKSKKTGRSKGYAFVEFFHPEVAEIAAETMNNYLMFNRLIKTRIVPPEQQRSFMFKEKFKKRTHLLSRNKTEKVVRKSKVMLTKNRDSYISKSMKKLNRIQKSMKNLGLDYKVKVAGLHEGVTLTSIKTIDPDNKSIQIKKEESDTSKTKKSKGKKGKVAPSPSESMIEESNDGAVATFQATRNTAVKKAVVKQLTAAKNKAVKITKAKGKCNTDGEKDLKKSGKTDQQSLTANKSKKTKEQRPASVDQSQPATTKADGVKKMVKTAQQKLTKIKSKKPKGKPSSTTTSLVPVSPPASGKIDGVKKIAKTLMNEQLSSVKVQASHLSKAISKTKKKIQNKKGTKKTKNNLTEDDSKPLNTQPKTPIISFKSKTTKKSPPSDKLRKTKKMASPLKKKSNKAKLETTV